VPIIHDVEQGTAAWYALRLGIPTSSDFHKIITPGKGEFSTQSDKYAFRLIAEAVLHQPLDSISHLEQIARGKQLEPDAANQYAFVKEVEIRKVGFITSDDGRIGCSPDRLVVGGMGALEIKCPAPDTHIGYRLIGPGLDYKPQVQGQMFVAELEWVDFYSYHPLMPPVLIRTQRDAAYLAKMARALRQFDDMLRNYTDLVRREGYFDARPQILTPIDQMAEEMAYATGTPIDWTDERHFPPP
jgi:hypothetical protein